MKYTPTWLNRSWGRKNGFKGKTKRHSVDYDREKNAKLVRLNGEFSREDLMGIVWELETNYAIKGLFAPITNKGYLKTDMWRLLMIVTKRQKVTKRIL